MYLSPNEIKLLECSIFHYFIWRQEEAKPPTYAKQQNGDTTTCTAVDTTSDNLQRSYKRIIHVMKNELPHVVAMPEETPTLSSRTAPEACFRWMNYVSNILGNTEILENKMKRKRNKADETVRLAKALKSIPEEAITVENAKEVLSTLREEHTESKNIVESLESKITKSEKIYSEVLKFNKKKLRLEKRLANLESSEAAATEQKLDNKDVSERKEGDGEVEVEEDQSSVREKLETKKRKVQLQETMYANAILYEVHAHKVQQQTTESKEKRKKFMDFESRLQQLIEFKQEFGHCQVGKEKNPPLNYWLMKQRQNYRLNKPILTPERIAKLDALGVVWDVVDGSKQRTFDAYVEQCRDFKEKHGHLRIPLLTERINEDGTEPTEEDVRFRIWAQSIRKRYQLTVSGGKNGLDKHRIELLDSIGFHWSIDATNVEGGSNIDAENHTPNEIMFRTRIEQLRKVKEMFGNCNEKKDIVSVYPNNNSLLEWIKQQRKEMRWWLAGKRTRLSEERIEMLRSIEFEHDPMKKFTATPSIKKTSNKKTWPTKMEILARELQEQKNNNQDSDNDASELDNDDIDK